MAKISQASGLTETQAKWFASVREGLERDTGRSLEAWVEIAKTCPETRHRARLAWFKTAHGLLQNRASLVLATAFPEDRLGWSDPDALRSKLWRDPAAEAVLVAVEGLVADWPGVIIGQRTAFTAFSRRYQFAALRPAKTGVVVGLALCADGRPGLRPSGRESWSERLTAACDLSKPEEAADIEPWLRAAFQAS